MSQLLEAFILGNGAILGNVCLLPLYPGLIAFLAGSAANGRSTGSRGWLGALVLAGVLSMMLLLGFVVYLLQQSFGPLLTAVLPVIYGVVLVMGVLMLFGFNPFVRLMAANVPLVGRPAVAAYVYGLLLGPMTLPCTGPLIVSAFVLGTGSVASLVEGLAYFLAFGLGFGWPLVLLPLLAQTGQRSFTRWLTSNHDLLARASGLLLIAIGLFGFWVEVLPNI